MKTRSATLSASLVIMAAILALTPSARVAAQNDATKGHHHYKLIDLGKFGGPASYVNPASGNDTGNHASVLNAAGAVAGSADINAADPFFPNFCFNENCFVSHAFEWKNGTAKDLGVLPGGASSAGNWISSNGLIAGLSENGEIDPLIPGLPEVRAVLWAQGEIRDLGTLGGGFESAASAGNSLGDVVGLALNDIPDPDSMLGLGFQTRAFLWQKGEMQDLGTLGSGTDAQAILVNERGEVLGWSYLSSVPTSACVEGFTRATGSFIWDKKNNKMMDLGGLGGTCTLAEDWNSHDQIIGASNLEGDQSMHAFLWERGLLRDLGGSLGGNFSGAFAINEPGIATGFAFLPDASFHAVLWKSIGQLTDLDTLGSDPCSFSTSINARMQVGGGSGDCTENFRAFLWENGSMADLNDLIPPGSSLYLESVVTINDAGEIAGNGSDSNGNSHAYLAIPCDENHPNVEGCDYDLFESDSAKPFPLPLRQRAQTYPDRSIWQKLFHRMGSRLLTLKTIRAEADEANMVTANAVSPLKITSGTPPSGVVGRAYDFHCTQIPLCNVFVAGYPVTAAGGLPTYSWSWAPQAGSALPPGLIFPAVSRFSDCLNVHAPAICGKPTTAGTYEVVITVKDSESPPRRVSAAYTIHIFP